MPVGGLVVVETPSRRNAGAHYTPRSLAEEVVLHALEPLVYEPGPLQTNDEDAWRLKSSTRDPRPQGRRHRRRLRRVPRGRGAVSRRTVLVEAWIAEGVRSTRAVADPELAERRAIREVIARCLYGADINPMAVEMCKLSLWLVSMDKTKPFSFVDDKIFCGNSLLGVTSLDQLRYLHIYPDPTTMDRQLLVDIDAKIAEATQTPPRAGEPGRRARPHALRARQASPARAGPRRARPTCA